VTADGALLHTDADRHPDLFWAIRGGGGNFGVATRLKFRLHPVDQVIGGLLMWPATPELVAALLAAADAAPQELSGMVNVLPAPPLPLVPSEYHGKLVAVVPLCHADGGEAGERAVAAFRAIAKPVVDLVRPMRYPELYQVAERPKPVLEASRTLFLDAVDQRTAEVVVDRLRAASSPLVSAQLRVLGGAMARVPVEATAFAHRQRRLMVGVGASYERPEEAPIRQQWADDLAAALRQLEPASVPGAYPGFMADEGEARIREAYPGPTWDRLRAVKRRYDPTNLFRRNQNIPPATA
jgi:FAD/FMN-containing dehydrogenase